MPGARRSRRDPRLSVWVSGFRPFFLGAAVYAPLSLVLWLAARNTGSPAYAAGGLWHGHELLFGFAAALVCAILLTALPSWTGAAEIRGAPLAVLAALWLAGRVAMNAVEWLPRGLVVAVDSALLLLLPALLFSTIRNARQRLFWWTLPPLAAFAAANVVFHVWNPYWGLQLGVHALAFLFTLYGGLFIPAFTRRYLLPRGERCGAILMPLEYATAAAMVAFAAADLLRAPPALMISAALVAAAVHSVRFARWRGWRTGGEPMLWPLHLGYAWLIAGLLLRAAAELTPRVPREAWVHAFTLGAYGMLKIGLMPRVALRHTGRALRVPPAMIAAFFMVLGGALVRLAYSVYDLGEWALAASVLLWGAAFVVYLALYAPMLVQPSLPRQ
ncbi:MAG: NnrS family protein [Betaproteobacteria bacterium]|nr:MAG: NnrS family protein [Betaproteobacteria bacterium]